MPTAGCGTPEAAGPGGRASVRGGGSVSRTPVRGAAGAGPRENGRLLAETRADGTVVEREVTGEAEARRLLDEEFGIEASDGMTLPPPA